MQEQHGNVITFWQTNTEVGIPEQALMIINQGSYLQLSQEGRWINLDFESLDEFISILKNLKKDWKHDKDKKE